MSVHLLGHYLHSSLTAPVARAGGDGGGGGSGGDGGGCGGCGVYVRV